MPATFDVVVADFACVTQARSRKRPALVLYRAEVHGAAGPPTAGSLAEVLGT
jgi:hypothetical protein